jgi:FtsP/CotA-like multicopper oxidase with cupredoxin domain
MQLDCESFMKRTMNCGMNRRHFLAASAGAAYLSSLPARAQDSGAPDFTVRIGSVDLEIAPRRIFKTIGYNGSVPGPPLRMTEGQPVTIDVWNDTSAPELVHWHGLFIPSEVDGSAEEGTPPVPPKGRQRYQFTPRPSGARWYHSHTYAGRNLHRSVYTGQFGFLQIVPRQDPARYDQEVLLALHGWDPYLTPMGGSGESGEGSLEVGYNFHSVNSHALGFGEPVRVREGQRVLFRILNASATDAHRLALPGHQFTVVGLDGNAVPTPRAVAAVELAPAERIDAIVEMKSPGVWILGEADDKMRQSGLGVVIEYANREGPPQWSPPAADVWDYTLFGHDAAGHNAVVAEPDERVPLVFKPKFAGNRWVDHWTINGKEFPKTDPIRVKANGRYRMIFDNQSDDAHPVHLHRHSFELVSIAGKPTAGVMKDVVMCPPRKKVEVQFVADNPGPTLFHCHQQLHMDFGFMAMVEYEGYKSPAPMPGHHA